MSELLFCSFVEHCLYIAQFLFKIKGETVSSHDNDKDFVLSLEKGLAIIQIYNEMNKKMTLSETAELLGITRATSRRFLKTLTVLGYMQTDDKYYWLSPKVLELSRVFNPEKQKDNIFENMVKKLSLYTGETCSINVRQAENSVCIQSFLSERLMNIHIQKGDQTPLWLSASGRVFLAQLNSDELNNYLKNIEYKAYSEFTVKDENSLIFKIQQVKNQGYCFLDQEYEKSLVSLAVPLKDQKQNIIASMCIYGADSRFSQNEISKYLEMMLVMAEYFKNKYSS
ncbi:IclR family transcriptional regulator domain-containing protein [Acinetobacter gerneri]|uniref:IclR family transcriptional regulator domain-containing protein n=1 Tax=Acinetobacter gerneri TaxID=202952 RepID=UPI0023F41F7E|nr:IclR family transcriptional regulator C-terminal domain-containing protein [Acinetobacter gerneri]